MKCFDIPEYRTKPNCWWIRLLQSASLYFGTQQLINISERKNSIKALSNRIEFQSNYLLTTRAFPVIPKKKINAYSKMKAILTGNRLSRAIVGSFAIVVAVPTICSSLRVSVELKLWKISDLFIENELEEKNKYSETLESIKFFVVEDDQVHPERSSSEMERSINLNARLNGWLLSSETRKCLTLIFFCIVFINSIFLEIFSCVVLIFSFSY